MALKLKEIDLGDAGSGTTLAIATPAAHGFFATGLLERDVKTVTTWESTDLCGQEVRRRLVAAGTYVVRLSIAFVGKDSVEVPLTFTTSNPGGDAITKSVSFSGKKGDIARAKVFVVVAGAAS